MFLCAAYTRMIRTSPLSLFPHVQVIMFWFSVSTGLVQKAKKAKDKLLKRDGDDRPDTGSYESFYYGGVDPYMWEPQELGDRGQPEHWF